MTEINLKNPVSPERLLSLDFFRGFTMLLLIAWFFYGISVFGCLKNEYFSESNSLT